MKIEKDKVIEEIYKGMYNITEPKADWNTINKNEKEFYMKYYLSDKEQANVIKFVCDKYELPLSEMKIISREIFTQYAPNGDYEAWQKAIGQEKEAPKRKLKFTLSPKEKDVDILEDLDVQINKAIDKIAKPIEKIITPTPSTVVKTPPASMAVKEVTLDLRDKKPTLDYDKGFAEGYRVGLTYAKTKIKKFCDEFK